MVSASRLEGPLDLPGVPAFVLAEEDEPLIEIEIAERTVCLLYLAEGEPIC